MVSGFEGERIVGSGGTYALINDCKKFSTFAEFKSAKNSENYQTLPAAYAHKDQVSVNLKAIAQVCNCSAE